jgi:hypothetical protein
MGITKKFISNLTRYNSDVDYLDTVQTVLVNTIHHDFAASPCCVTVKLVEIKVKFTLEQATKFQGEYRYSTTLSLTSALHEVGGQRHAPAALTPGKTRYILYRTLGGP